MACVVPLTGASGGIGMEVGVCADDESLVVLATKLFGDVDPSDFELLQDFLSETANVVGGRVKECFIEDGTQLTIGIPKPISVDVFRRRSRQSARSHQCAFGIDGVTLTATLALAAVENERILARNLREGMVLVVDLRNTEGILLVKAGTRISSALARRLAASIPDQSVEVSAPAG